MASTFFGLNIGKSGLYAYQIGINTTAHNIANAETNGYTRQVVNKQASKPLSVGTSYGMVGTGVDVTSIEQVRSKYLDEKYSYNMSVAGEYAAKDYYMKELETYFNEITVDGFTTSFDNLYSTLQNLSTNPSSGTTRTQVATFAQNLTEYLNSLHTSLSKIQQECNTEVKNIVDRVNSIGDQIAILNKQINSVEAGGERANDLRDQRALLIDELSEYVTVNVTEKTVGDKDCGITQYVVTINGQTFVDTNMVNKLDLVVRQNPTNILDVDGIYDIRWASGANFNAMGAGSAGSLNAVLQVRDGNNGEVLSGRLNGAAHGNTLTMTDATINDIDQLNITAPGKLVIGRKEYEYKDFKVEVGADGKYTYTFTLKEPLTEAVNNKVGSVGDKVDYKGIPYYMSQLNEFVRVYAQRFNDIHKSGRDFNGEQGADFFVGVSKTGNTLNFVGDEGVAAAGTVLYDSSVDAGTGSYYRLNISNIAVNPDILKDPNKVVTFSSTEPGVENTDVLKKLIALKGDTGMFKQGTPKDFFQTMVGEIGVNAKTATDLAQNQQDICDAIENQRLSVAGVDTDEEAINLVKYQNCYNLSSKVISVMDELLDRLINYTGV